MNYVEDLLDEKVKCEMCDKEIEEGYIFEDGFPVCSASCLAAIIGAKFVKFSVDDDFDL